LRGLAGTARKNMLDIIDFAFVINDRVIFIESIFFDKKHLLKLDGEDFE